MRNIAFSGIVPATLVENSRPGGWAGGLTISIDPGQVRFVDVIGTADVYLDSSFDRSTGTVSLWNVASPDYEAFSRIGAAPVLNFQLRVFLTDGTTAMSTEIYSLAVADVDDTPPTGLRFANGGAVAPGDIGATIGTLAVTDPDSAGPFFFTIDPTDAWQYEVVGSALKLKPGLTVAISDGPFRALNVEVSDGHQSAAFRLEIRVESPAGEQAVLDVLDPWEVKSGFSWKNADTVQALRGGWEVARVDFYGEALIDLVMRDGAQVWLPAVGRIEFLNGTLDMRQHGSADLVNATYQAVLGRLADRDSLGPAVRALDAGKRSVDDMIGDLLSSQEYQSGHGGLNNEQFVRMLYRNTEGGVPNEPGVQSWKAALDSGASRLAVTKSFVTWEVSLNNIDAVHPHGWWVERPLGAQVASIYDVALDRAPDRGGFDYWMGELEKGVIGLNNLAILFGRSEEFTSKYAAFSTRDFVRELYRTSLDREPDADGFSFWVNALDTGILHRDNMIYAFGFNDEKLGTLATLPAGEPFFS